MDVPPHLKDGVEALMVKVKRAIKHNKKHKKQWSMSDFEIGMAIGNGTFGNVYLAREKRSELIVALKVMKKHHIVKEKLMTQVMREISIHKSLQHRYILPLYNYFHNETEVVLILEFAGNGTLYDALRKSSPRGLSEARAAKYVHQTSDALAYCHSKSIVHRDLKPENVLIDCWDNVKLSDFGWSLTLSPFSPVTTVCGTDEYFAPEMVTLKQYDNMVDVWCVGILCYECLVGSSPFASNDPQEIYDKILNSRIYYPTYIKPPAKDLISKLLRRDPQKRLTLDKVMAHPWISKHYRVVQTRTSSGYSLRQLKKPLITRLDCKTRRCR